MLETFYDRMARNRPLRLLALLCGTSLFGAFGAPAALAAGSLAELQADFSHQLALAGPRDGAYVYDLTARQPIFSERATTPRPPASVEKLFTASTALTRLGAEGRLATSVLGVGQLAPGGVWEGSLYLHGGGDPTFGSSAFIRRHYGGQGASISGLVRQLVRVDGIHHVTGLIEGDESHLDRLRGEPSSGFAEDPFLEGRLSGLAFNRGETGSERGAHAPAAYAARRLWSALKADGVSIRGASGAAIAPAGATVLAQAPSPTVAQLLGLMLPPSDNFFAETLLKDIGASFAHAGTTAAGASVVTSTVGAMLGSQPHVVDGSGLSAQDATSPSQVAQLLVQLASTPTGAVLREHLAVAGRTGTLARRMRHTGAAGRCQGKTGTLIGVSNLVGYCRSAGGHEFAFAIFTDGIGVEAAHVFQDHMAITIADSKIGANGESARATGALSPPLVVRR
jgi:D-alanyl-D-alanine carboxypeptidase/D-alanyl-D-alanine-endopeptidase (penicillin-binding protein 4)